MGRIDNTGDDPYAELLRRIEALETGNPLANASVTDGRTRFVGQDAFILDGTGRVIGVLYVDGRIVIDGDFALDGVGTVSGPFTVTGPMRVEGPQQYIGDSTREGDQVITGKTDHEGDFNLLGDMNVSDGGKVTVKGPTDMTIGLLNNGQAGINFGNAVLYSDGTRAALRAGGALVGAENNGAQLSYNGDGFRAGSDGNWIAGLSAPPAGAALYSVVATADGRLYRVPRSTTTPGDGEGPVDT